DGVEWVRENLDWHDSKHGQISTFETSIRALGGLLAAFDLSGDEILLTRARELADGLMNVFDTKTGIASPRTTLFRGGGGSGGTTLAEAGTLQLEFNFLTQLTGDDKYRNASRKFHDFLYEKHQHDSANDRGGMFPIGVNTASGQLSGVVSWGASGDSAYEYFLKCFLLSQNTDVPLLEMYNRAVNGMKDRLVKTTSSGLRYLPDNGGGAKMEHLACFVPGLLALGVIHEDDGGSGGDIAGGGEMLKLAEDLADACWQMYEQTATGLAPEAIMFNDDGSVRGIGGVKWNILRPESVESFFILYELTGDEKYRERAFKVWEAFEKHCKAEWGYGAHPDVFNVNNKCCRGNDDKQETFWMAET
ncbi:hypothetical protein ScalyP_jg5734, partial [Parmales sp. scaly parma]